MKKIALVVLGLLTPLAAFAEENGPSAVAPSTLIMDVEYVPTSNGVDNAWGFGAYMLKEQDVGYYFNLQATLTKREPHYASLNVNSFGDPVTARYKELTIGNIGLTKKLNDNFGLYGGIGYGAVTGVARKYDPMLILGNNGTYYVPDTANDKSGVNLNLGALVSSGNVSLNVGYHSFAKTAYFGIGGSY